MSYAETHAVVVTTDGDGNGVGYTPVINSRVQSIRYVKPVAGSYTDGVDFDVTGDVSGIVIWDEDNVNASATRAPRQATHGATGVAALYAGAGLAVNDHIWVAGERIKIAVAAGGAAKTGTFYVTVG